MPMLAPVHTEDSALAASSRLQLVIESTDQIEEYVVEWPTRGQKPTALPRECRWPLYREEYCGVAYARNRNDERNIDELSRHRQ